MEVASDIVGTDNRSNNVGSGKAYQEFADTTKTETGTRKRVG